MPLTTHPPDEIHPPDGWIEVGRHEALTTSRDVHAFTWNGVTRYCVPPDSEPIVRKVKEVRLDGRRRVSLKGIGNPDHKRYRVEQLDGGVLRLTPVVSIPARYITETVRAHLMAEGWDGK